MKLIDDWRSAIRGYSTVALGLIVAVETIWLALPVEALEAIPHELRGRISLAVALFGGFGRFIKQGRGPTE